MRRLDGKAICTGVVGRLACVAMLPIISIGASSQDLDETDDFPLHEVFVFLETPQDVMLGPDAMRPGPGDADYVDVYGITGMIHGIRSLANRIDDQTVEDGLQSVLGQFDFESATKNMLATVEVNSNWVAWETEERESFFSLRGSAKRAFRQTPVDYVLGFATTYFLSPGLDQVRLIADIRLYKRPSGAQTPRPLFTRHYEYVSPSVGEVVRPFHDGEKEALAAEIEEQYDRLSTENPANAAENAKEKARVLERLAGRKVIPPGQAIREGWPDGSMARALRLASRHVEHMMSMDLRILRGPAPESGERIRFEALDRQGDPDRKRGYRIGTLDGNTIYRDNKRNYYSLP